MSLLASRFREIVSKEKDIRIKQEARPSMSYPTGFLSFDFLNGTISHGKAEGKEYKYYSVGIPDGTLVMTIGRTGCGKTTFVLQSAGNIVRPFKNAVIYHDDGEGGIADERKQQLTGLLDPDEYKSKYISRNTGITAENFYQRIIMIHDIKLADPDNFMYDTGHNDIFGERIFKFQPTVYILDSLTQLMPDSVTEEEELSGQMSTTSTAKTTANIIRRIIPKLKSANIILFIINHILEDVQIGIFKKKADLGYLKQGERIPGGRTPLYLANNVIRLDDVSKLKEGEGFDIDGMIVSASLLKSRSNKANKSVNLVFTQEKGFDYDLSLLLLLKENKRLKGAGAYLSIGDCPIKFSQKQFKDKLAANPELQQAFNIEVAEILKTLVREVTYESVNKSVVTENILTEMNNQLIA